MATITRGPSATSFWSCTVGWRVIPTPSSAVGSIDGNIYIPSWNSEKLNDDNLHDVGIDINHDYFCDISVLVKYLVKHGNVEIESTGRSRRRGNSIKKEAPAATSASSSSSSGGADRKRGTSEAPKSKKAKNVKVERACDIHQSEFTSPEDRMDDKEEEEEDDDDSDSNSSSPSTSAEERIRLAIALKKKHAFPDVWKILRKELNWKCVNDTHGILCTWHRGVEA